MSQANDNRLNEPSKRDIVVDMLRDRGVELREIAEITLELQQPYVPSFLINLPNKPVILLLNILALELQRRCKQLIIDGPGIRSKFKLLNFFPVSEALVVLVDLALVSLNDPFIFSDIVVEGNLFAFTPAL